MGLELCIDAAQLRRAMMDLEAAEANGFMHCLAVLRFASVGPMLSDNRLEYSDMIERAHPTDGRLDWGRFQRVSARHKFVGGELVPLTPNAELSGAPAQEQR